MGGLLASVAHELNNPLAIALGRTALLQEKCADPDLQDDLQRIRSAIERCVRTVRTFLDMARARPPRRAAVSLNEVASAAADLLRYTFKTHGIELTLQLDDTLPRITGDADQLTQVVVNLLVNAKQALLSVNEDRRVAVRTGWCRRTRCTWLSVCDSGLGVPPQVRATLFEPFVTTKAEGLGTGLGLPVSRALARAHGGELSLDEKNGCRGARFILRLPVGSVVSDAASASAPLAAHPPPGERLLVVDDEPELAEVMRSMLQEAGFSVVAAHSGREALSALAEHRFDGVVSDLRMPDLDGAALWRRMRRHCPRMAGRMLFVTGDTLSADMREFLRACGCTCLEKPFEAADLVAAVKAMLHAASAAQ